MKKRIAKLMSKFKRKLFRIKLTGSDRVHMCQERVAGAFEMFKKADEELTEANLELSKVIQAEREVIEKAYATLDKADAELRMNNTLKSRLADFVPK